MTEKIIKWRSVEKDGLPDKSCEVLIMHNRCGLMVVSYAARHKCFNAYDTSKEEILKKSREIFKDVTHWAPISEIFPEEAENEKAD